MSLTDDLRAAPPGCTASRSSGGSRGRRSRSSSGRCSPGWRRSRPAPARARSSSRPAAPSTRRSRRRRTRPTASWPSASGAASRPSSLTFRIGSSADVLRDWKPRELDLVLVDGAHAFPYPTLDWWYLHPHLKTGGLMLLDDAYMPPVAAVVDHLRDSGAWRLERAGQLPHRRRPQARRRDDRRRMEGAIRMNFCVSAARPRAVAAVRQRVFSTQRRAEGGRPRAPASSAVPRRSGLT